MKKLAIAALMSAALIPAMHAQESDDVQPDAADETSLEGYSEDGDMLSEEEEEPEQRGPTYNQERMATLRALDKITGRSTDFEIEVGEPIIYGSLKVDLKVCFQTPPEEPPESAAFLQIMRTDASRMDAMTEPRLASDVESEAAAAKAAAEDTVPLKRSGEEEEDPMLFSGWMFASSPGLSALEHPVYDVWVIRCRQPSPESLSSPATQDE